jgi:uncharacterized protein YerC
MKNKRGLLIGQSADRWAERVWDEFLEKIVKSRTKTEAKKLLGKIISEYEKEDIIRRLAILALIRQGYSYKKIGEILWVSPQTISGIKKSIMGGEEFYRSQRSLRKKEKYRGNQVYKKSIVSDSLEALLLICTGIITAPLTATQYRDNYQTRKNK